MLYFGHKPFASKESIRAGKIYKYVYIFIVVVIGGGSFIADLYKRNDLINQKRDWSNQFTEHLNQYVSLAETGTYERDPYIKGKVIVLEIKKNENVSIMLSNLNGELDRNGVPVARNPSEVGTIVLIKYFDNYVGYYQNGGGKAIRVDCCLTIIDKHNKKYSRKILRGVEPPKKIIRFSRIDSGDIKFKAPSDYEVIQALRSLPSKS